MSYSTTIPRLIEDATERFSGSDALIDDGVRLTYAELREWDRHGSALIASGIERGDRVASGRRTSASGSSPALGMHSGRGARPAEHAVQGPRGGYVLDQGPQLLFTVTGFLDTDYVRCWRGGCRAPRVQEIVVSAATPCPRHASLRRLPRPRDPGRHSEHAERATAVSPTTCHMLFTSGTTGAQGRHVIHGAAAGPTTTGPTASGSSGRPIPHRQPVLPLVRAQAGLLVGLMKRRRRSSRSRCSTPPDMAS